MNKIYRITPLDKKSVEYFVDVYEELSNGNIRGFSVTEVWRWGQGFREIDNLPWEYEVENGVGCDPQLGWGCELDDLISVYVDFGDGFSDEEKQYIESILCGEQEDSEGRWGTTWLYDGEHNWQIEEDTVRILSPLKIDLVDADGYGEDAVLEENIKPYESHE